jgi:hypothetical protein
MNQLKKSFPSLAEIEREVVAESREWGRQRLAQRLQQLADEQSEVFPPAASQASKGGTAKRIGKNKGRH